jgi:hypothetical protein
MMLPDIFLATMCLATACAKKNAPFKFIRFARKTSSFRTGMNSADGAAILDFLS